MSPVRVHLALIGLKRLGLACCQVPIVGASGATVSTSISAEQAEAAEFPATSIVTISNE